MAKKIITPVAVTAAQLAQWKAQYVDIFEIEISDADGPMRGYFRKPDLDILAAAYSSDNFIKQGQILFSNCWLGGDTRIDTEADCKLAAIGQIQAMFKPRVASLKKL